MKDDLTRRIITVIIVWLFSFLLSVALTSLIPFLHLNGEYWSPLHISITRIPVIALVIVLIVDMLKQHDFDILTLVITFLIGLPGALFYFLTPRKRLYLYGSVLSVSALWGLLISFKLLPLGLQDYNIWINILMNIVVMVLLTKDKSRQLTVGQWVWLWIIGLYMPACSVLLYYALSDIKASPATLKKYIIPAGIVAILYIANNVVYQLMDLLSAMTYTAFFNAVTILFGLYVFIVMFCDRRVRVVRDYGWLAVASLFSPGLFFPTARLLDEVKSEVTGHCFSS